MSLCSADDVGMADTCMCCGGSASLGGTQEPWQADDVAAMKRAARGSATQPNLFDGMGVWGKLLKDLNQAIKAVS